MATQEQIKAFIELIAPIVQKYAKEYGYKVASPIIAQACCESAFGTSWISKSPYWNLFGMKCGGSWKGRSVSATTKEEYTIGSLTSIVANFRAYDSVDEGVKGYFDFISSSRYKALHDCATAKEYLETIKGCGYATSSSYVTTNMNLVIKYNLERFDDFEAQPAKLIFKPTKDEAKALQQMLNEHGFTDENGSRLVLDGIVGKNTTYALKKFCEWFLGTEQ